MNTKLKYISIFLTIFSLLGVLKIGSPEAGVDSEIIFSQNLESFQISTVQNNSLLAVSNPSNPEPKVVKKIRVVVTAYSSTPWQTDDTPFITASNTHVRKGIIANNFFRFGTRIRIPELYGDKIFVVEDRMHWRKSNYHFDIWFPSLQQAKNFGVKRTYIEILES